MVVLYSNPLSPFGRMAQSVLELTETEYEFKNVDLAGGENKQEWFTKLNPAQTVPVLVDGDLILTESKAIMKYVCYKKGETSIYPSDPATRAKVDQAIERAAIIKQGNFIPQLFG